MRTLAHVSVDAHPDLLGACTAGLSGAELANLVNEAALAAVRHGRASVCMADFREALDTYRTSRSFGDGAADADADGADGTDGAAGRQSGAPDGGMAGAILATVLHSMQQQMTRERGGGGGAAVG